MSKIYKNKNLISIVLSVFVSVMFVVVTAYAATTISTNISTEGTLAVTGASTFTGKAQFNGNLQASSTALFTNGLHSYDRIIIDDPGPTFTGASSRQTVQADANFSDFSGFYGAGVMGNALGTIGAGADSIVAGLIGKYNIATNNSDHPAAGVVAEVGEDSAGTSDAAFIAVLGGDSGAVTSGAAYAVRSLNSTTGTYFNYGLDLKITQIDSYNQGLTYNTADIRLQNGETISNATNGTIGFVSDAGTITGENHGIDLTYTGTLSSGDQMVGINSVVTTAGTAGTWASAVYGKVIQGATKNVNGYITGGEFEVANTNTAPSELFTLVLDSNSAAYDSNSAYIWGQDFGSADMPNLLKLTGTAVGTNSATAMVSSYTTASSSATHSIKIMINGTPYWILLSNVAPH